MTRNVGQDVSASFIGRVAYCPHAAYLSTQKQVVTKASVKNTKRGNKAHAIYNDRHTGVGFDKQLFGRLAIGVFIISCVAFLVLNGYV